MKILLALLFTFNAYAYNPTVTLEYDVNRGQNKTDILFVIDNSGSMGEHQSKLVNLKKEFIGELKSVDYKVTAISSDIRDIQRNHIITSNSSNPYVEFAQLISSFGTNGDASERTFSTVNIFNNSQMGKDFFRKEATSEIIFVSDEEEQSPETVEQTINSFNRVNTVASALIPFRDAKCKLSGDDMYEKYNEIVLQTKGSVFNICLDEQRLAGQIQFLAGQIVKRAKTNKLPKLPIQEIQFTELVKWNSIEVKYGAQVIEKGLVDTGWIFNESENKLYFGAKVKLDPSQALGSKLTIKYKRY